MLWYALNNSQLFVCEIVSLLRWEVIVYVNKKVDAVLALTFNKQLFSYNFGAIIIELVCGVSA